MTDSLHGNDKVLLQRVVKGCQRSFEALFKKYHGFLYQYAFRVFRDQSVADEVVHKTFIKIWEVKGTLPEIQSVKSYLFSVNRHLVINELRTISRNRRLAERLAHNIEKSHNAVEEEVMYNDLQQVIQNAIAQLPRKRKEIFELSRHGGFSHKEIAHKLNISENTVKVSVHKSLKQIRDFMSLVVNVSFYLLLNSTLW